MADTLVIKCNIPKHPADVEILRQSIIEQRRSGVVILPCYCEAIVVPEDIRIEMEETIK